MLQKNYQNKLISNPDTGKTVATVALVGAVGFGAYMLLKPGLTEGIPAGLKITKYRNLRTGVEVTSGFLDVENGDTMRVSFEYAYFGPALSGTYHVTLWQKGILDPHDEVGPYDLPFDKPEYLKETKIEEHVDMEIKAGRGNYGLYMKIMGIPKGDIFSPYYANRIRVSGGDIPSEEWVSVAEVANMTIFSQAGVIDMWYSVAIVSDISIMVQEAVINLWYNVAITENMSIIISSPATISFTVKGDGFPFLTSKWLLYYYETDGDIIGDDIQYNPGDVITFNDVKPQGKLSCYCASAITGEWSTQFFSGEYIFWDDSSYKYNIDSGEVFFR